jgi:hypothetical protein
MCAKGPLEGQQFDIFRAAKCVQRNPAAFGIDKRAFLVGWDHECGR